MNHDGMKENLSALVDNELDEVNERRIWAALEGDVALRNTWERYHLVRAALRQDLEVIVAHDMAERVAKQIAAEPSIAATFKRRRLVHFMGTFAIAASVAMLAVFGIQRSNNNNTLPESPAIAANQVITPVAEPQSFAFTEPQILPAAVKKSDTPTSSIANQRMNSYLVNYKKLTIFLPKIKLYKGISYNFS